jgi:hypothetical protein
VNGLKFSRKLQNNHDKVIAKTNFYDKDKKEFWSGIEVKTIFYPLCCLNLDAEKVESGGFKGATTFSLTALRL